MRIVWAAMAVATTLVMTPLTAEARPASSLTAGTSVSTGTVARAVAAKPKKYANCKALNKVYKHGVGRKGAKDKTSGKKVKNFTVNNTVYNLNKKSDRDKDGIACEKR